MINLLGFGQILFRPEDRRSENFIDRPLKFSECNNTLDKWSLRRLTNLNLYFAEKIQKLPICSYKTSDSNFSQNSPIETGLVQKKIQRTIREPPRSAGFPADITHQFALSLSRSTNPFWRTSKTVPLNPRQKTIANSTFASFNQGKYMCLRKFLKSCWH